MHITDTVRVGTVHVNVPYACIMPLHCRPMDSRIIKELELFYSEVRQILVEFTSDI